MLLHQRLRLGRQVLVQRLGHHQSDDDHVRTDVLLAILGRDVAREPQQAGLGRAIGGIIEIAGEALAGAGEDDRAAALLQHVRDGVLCRQHRAGQVGREGLVPEIERHVGDRGILEHRPGLRRVAVQDIEPAEGFDGAGNARRDRVFAGHVHDDRQSPAARRLDLGDHAVQLGCGAPGDRHRGTPRRKHLGRGAADAATATGDHRDLALERSTQIGHSITPSSPDDGPAPVRKASCAAARAGLRQRPARSCRPGRIPAR